MLSRILIRNYALISEVEIHFSEGFTVLTGETGAGKTLLVGALGLVLGRRADRSVLFNQEQKCVVEAEFTGLSRRIMKQLVEFDGFDLSGDTLTLRRELAPAGTSRAFINDTPVQAALLREVAQLLIDLHGQHENQLLLSAAHQLDMLDLFAGSSADAEAFAKDLEKLREAEARVKELRTQEAEARRQLDYYQFQLKELEAADLHAEEEESLEQEIRLLEHAEEIREQLGGAGAELYENEDSLYNRLAQILSRIGKLSSVSERIHSQVEKLREAEQVLKETAFDLQDIAAEADTDPGRLEALFEKQNAWNKLKLRFAVRSVAELIALRAEFAQKANEFSSIEGRIRKLETEISGHGKNLAATGLVLEAKRQKAAPALSKKVNALMKEVGLEQAEFSIQLERAEAGTGSDEVAVSAEGRRYKCFSKGLNRITFQIRTNKGTATGPLAQVASGGEMSRVMLALKAALAEKADLEVMVFDEIDTGISGETANKVARVMKALAEKVQVLAITHLPQIAGRGNRHLRVWKETQSGKTLTRVEEISRKERVNEIAKMLSGDPPGKNALKNAEEILEG